MFTVLYDFQEEGDYIGVVTAAPANSQRQHIAVFPFEVGYTGYGYWPLIVSILAALVLLYLITGGRFAGRRG